MPVSMRVDKGAPFAITAATSIVVEGDSSATQVARSLAALLRPSTTFPLPVASGAPAAGSIIRLSVKPGGASDDDESYDLTVTSAEVHLIAASPAGLFRGVQTIRQLLPASIESHMGIREQSWRIPAVTIHDAPRFAWRGAMLDVSRHFFTVKEVKQYIDMLELYKMNVLHLHLSDDQGFRIAIASRPKLTTIGAITQVGGGEGGFYTQADYGEIVRYAQARYITVVPEVDMPGHTNGALSAYPEASCSIRPSVPYTGTDVGWSTVCVDKEESYALIDDIVREISAITPGPYFHVGGDEVHTLSRADYVKFVERAQEIVGKYGKRMVGWEEVSKARLKPTSIAQMWTSDSVRAALQYGAKILMSPSTRAYLDMQYDKQTELGLHWAAYIPVRDAYDWDPATLLPGVSEDNLVGVEAAMWAETLRNIGAVMQLAMPRLPAIAEVAWSPQANRKWDDFSTRLARQAPRWKFLGVNYYPSPQVPW